jgi:Zn-dependent metalloprotease/PKD repeat protein
MNPRDFIVMFDSNFFTPANVKLTLSFCLLFFGAALHAQEPNGTAASQKIEGAVRIRLNASGSAPDVVLFDPAKAVSTDSVAVLQKRLFGNRPEDTWTLIRSEQDKLGMTHARYQQLYKNIAVEGCVYIFHGKDGKIVSANGDFVPRIALLTEPAITSEQAIAFAVAGMKEPLLQERTDETEAELVVLIHGQQPVLAWKCAVFNREPLVNVLVYIDAQNGAVLREMSRICSTDVPGTAITHFSGSRPVVADQVSAGNFLLRETGRGNGIETYDFQSAELYSDDDNIWNNVNASMDQFAGDAHFGAEATYDFFLDHFGRNSYDGNGGVIRSYVNHPIGANAFWSGGTHNTMTYGRGNTHYFPAASLEIAGHELSHGVTEYSAGLVYFNEPGSLNESFSDIFGITIRFLSTPSVATWYVGDQLLRPNGTGAVAFRNMSDPNEFQCADTYGGQFFNNGDIVHYDSGIQNYWYYLLAEGGNGTNDLGNTYAVDGIGLNDAVQIAYRNLAYYLTPFSDFSDARDGAELAAIDLFGSCSEQHMQTIHAWYAVGVGPDHTVFQPGAAYSTSGNFACSAPLSTQFFAAGNYSSYAWDFGDGTTSSVQTPTHTYVSDGYYTVTLIVSDNSACQQNDTLIVPNGIVIADIGPVAGFRAEDPLVAGLPVTFSDTSLYGPVSWEWDFGDGGSSALQHPLHTFADTGMYNVRLIVQNCHGADTIVRQIEVQNYILFCSAVLTGDPAGVVYDSGGPNGNYGSEEGCVLTIRPCNVSSITLTFDEFGLADGDRLTVMAGSKFFLFSAVSPPPPVLTLNSTSVILFFSSDSVAEQAGFKISYTSESGNFPGPNSAFFTADPGSGSPGQAIHFNDESANNPVARAWDFGDGSTSSATSPTHVYDAVGVYTVTLTATYCDGYTDVSAINFRVDDWKGDVLTVGPNPYADYFIVASKVSVADAGLRIVDLSGRKVYEQQVGEIDEQGTVIQPLPLSDGQYMLEAGYWLDGTYVTERHRIQVYR